MGAEFSNLTDEELCDLMCGKPEEDMEEDMADNVNHPKHYADTCSLECIESMLVAFGAENVYAFCICNAYKYLWRYKNKNGAEDLNKAEWYINKAEDIFNKFSNMDDYLFNIVNKEDVLLLRQTLKEAKEKLF